MSKAMVFGLAVILVAFFTTRGVCAIELPTAKQALALANAKLDPAIQDDVIVLEGRKSDTDLRPRVWDITVYDPKRLQGGTRVRVKDGAAVSVSASVRMFDDARWRRLGRNFSGYDADEIIDVGRWALDSDRVINAVRAQPKLSGLQLTEVVMTLRKPSDGDVAPVWMVQLRARPLNNPRRERWIGYLMLDAESGKLLVDELRVQQLLR